MDRLAVAKTPTDTNVVATLTDTKMETLTDTNIKTKSTVDLLYKDLSYVIQGIVFDIRKDFGLGHKEQIYQKAFEEELKRNSIPFQREASIRVYSPKDGAFIGLYRPDFLVDGKIIVELKAQKFLPRTEMKQMYNYLRNSEYELGYLINFAPPSAYIKRIILTNNRKTWLKRLLVFVGFLLVSVSGVPASAATLLVVPERERIEVGESTVLKVGLDSEGQAINVIDVRLTIPEGIEGVRVETSNSPVQFWLQAPRIDPSGKIVVAIGGVAGGGLTERVILFTLFVRPRVPGIFEIVPDASSRVYLADGQGAELTANRRGAKLTVLGTIDKAVPMRSSTHPDENQWYQTRDAEVLWQQYPDRVYSFSVDRDPAGVPDGEPDEVKLPLRLQNLADGMHFVHLREGTLTTAGLNWSEPAHFRLMIDGTPPEPFEPIILEEQNVFSVKPVVAYETTDKMSGLWYTAIREKHGTSAFAALLGEGDEIRTQEMVHIVRASKRFRVFGGEVSLTAYDQAENFREATLIIPRQPWLLEAGIAIPVLLGALIWIIVRVARLAIWRQRVGTR